MLVGIPPYYANSREQLFYNIENGILKIPSSISEEAKSLLKAVNIQRLSVAAPKESFEKIRQWQRRCRRNQMSSFL